MLELVGHWVVDKDVQGVVWVGYCGLEGFPERTFISFDIEESFGFYIHERNNISWLYSMYKIMRYLEWRFFWT